MFRLCELFVMTERITIASLRKELGLTLDELAEQLGISSKGYLSQIERGVIDCSLSIALRIEEFSGGRIDAASLSRDVSMARASCAGGCTPDTSGTDQSSSGSCDGISPQCPEVVSVAGGALMPPAAEGVAAAHSVTPEGCGVQEAGA
jgi:DNA-binding XRE family transcriptional regulator